MQSYILQGVVERGQGDGAKLQAPTANLPTALAEQQQMPTGLYVCQVAVLGEHFEGLVYYGINSLTHKDCLEVHLRDFGQVLYGKTITITTLKYLREARFFASREELQEQIKNDLKEVGWVV